MDFQDEIDPQILLESAASWGLRSVVVLGWADGETFIWGTSEPSKAEVLYMLENAKADVMAKGNDPFSP